MLLQAQVTLEIAVGKAFIRERIEVVERTVAQFHVVDASAVAEAGAEAVRMKDAPVWHLVREVTIACSWSNIPDFRIVDHGLRVEFKYRCASHHSCYLGKGNCQGGQILLIERCHAHILLEAESHLRLIVSVQHCGQPMSRVGTIVLQRVEKETATIGRHHGQKVFAAVE